MINLEQITNKVCEIARTSGKMLKKFADEKVDLKIETKGIHDFVTFADKESEKFIVKSLYELLPEAGFIAEEGTSIKKGEIYNWVIDPLDGTTNYIHGIPLYSVSIALMKNDEVVSGVIYEPNSDECFYAWKGSKAFLNGKEISVTKTSHLSRSLVATGFPMMNYKYINQYFEVLKQLMFDTHGIRRLGSAAVDLAWVACGRFDAFYEYNLNPWDVAAGTLIVERAGGKNSDFSNKNNFIFGKEIISTNNLLHDELFKVIQKHFNMK